MRISLRTLAALVLAIGALASGSGSASASNSPYYQTADVISDRTIIRNGITTRVVKFADGGETKTVSYLRCAARKCTLRAKTTARIKYRGVIRLVAQSATCTYTRNDPDTNVCTFA